MPSSMPSKLVCIQINHLSPQKLAMVLFALLALRTAGRWAGIVSMNHQPIFNFSASIFKTNTPGLLKGGIWRDNDSAPPATLTEAFLGVVYVRDQILDLFVLNRSLSIPLSNDPLLRATVATKSGDVVSLVAEDAWFRAWISTVNVTVEGTRETHDPIIPPWLNGFAGGLVIGIVIAILGKLFTLFL